MKRALKAITVCAVAVVVATGCTPELPAVPPAPEAQERAALVDDQARAIIEDTFAELAAADEALDPEVLDWRVGSYAKTVRAAEYKVAEAVEESAPGELPSSMQAIYVSGTETWPRVLVAVSAQPQDDLTPVVLLWVQDDVDSPYQLRNWAHMVPGATMPAMPGPTNGATQLSIGDGTIEPSPRQVLEDYLELLRQGADSPLAANFAPDTYRERLFTARGVLTDAAKDADGAYVDAIQPKIADTYVLTTADGGALIFAPVSIASTFSVKNAKVSVPAGDKALLEGTLNAKVTHHYADMVVIYVPGPGVDARPTVVAAEHNVVRVTAG